LAKNGKKDSVLIEVVLDSQICGFCGSNTVPPDFGAEVDFSLALSQVS
jgi:hypothetical protein